MVKAKCSIAAGAKSTRQPKTYQEIIDWTNDIIIRSGIREYCQQFCEGRCCKDVACKDKTLPDAEKQCHYKISCASYICGDIRSICGRSMAIITNRLRDVYDQTRKFMSKHHLACDYASVHDKAGLEKLEFDVDLPEIPESLITVAKLEINIEIENQLVEKNKREEFKAQFYEVIKCKKVEAFQSWKDAHRYIKTDENIDNVIHINGKLYARKRDCDTRVISSFLPLRKKRTHNGKK